MWILTRRDTKELLTFPSLMKGERIKRFVGIKTNNPVTIGTITRTKMKKDTILKLMLKPHKDKNHEKMLAIANSLLEIINGERFAEEIKRRANTIDIGGLDVKPTFEGDGVSFSFPSIRQLVRDREGKPVKTLKTKRASISIKKAVVKTNPQITGSTLLKISKRKLRANIKHVKDTIETINNH